jgi:8-oxo-dGTP pyrophosphatase MutT (NUDIX family)
MPHHAKLPLWDDKSSEQKLETLRQMVEDLYAYTLADTRQHILEILGNALSYDDKERADIEAMKQLVKTHPNIMAQNCEIGHITGSALVCDYRGRCLLHYHKKLKRWLQVGGHADYESNFADVALREAQEETGLPDLAHRTLEPIDFDIHTIPASDTKPEHLHLDFRYMLMTNRPEEINPLEGESRDFVWANFDNLLNPSDPNDEKLLDPALKRLIMKCKRRFGAGIYPNSHKNTKK